MSKASLLPKNRRSFEARRRYGRYICFRRGDLYVGRLFVVHATTGREDYKGGARRWAGLVIYIIDLPIIAVGMASRIKVQLHSQRMKVCLLQSLNDMCALFTLKTLHRTSFATASSSTFVPMNRMQTSQNKGIGWAGVDVIRALASGRWVAH